MGVSEVPTGTMALLLANVECSTGCWKARGRSKLQPCADRADRKLLLDS